jgi:membrane-associated phospholipid phosphatase
MVSFVLSYGGGIMKNKIKSLWTQYRSLWIMILYAFLYLVAFFFLEQRKTSIYVINFGIDKYIPFCEVFVIPYLMWFGYVAFTVLYLCLKDKEEGDRLVAFLMIGMTIFIIVSAVFPNGHHLRPRTFSRNNIFTKLIAILYKTDTPTNVLPSIHVYNSVGVMIAVVRSSCFKKRKVIKPFMLGLGVSIICSTVLIKQHSMLDVLLALMMSAIMYAVCYKTVPVREKRRAYSELHSK